MRLVTGKCLTANIQNNTNGNVEPWLIIFAYFYGTNFYAKNTFCRANLKPLTCVTQDEFQRDIQGSNTDTVTKFIFNICVSSAT